ncbi:GNAT family N-acetyltransferase [Staphylococcus sp. ACRSN]|uniref:GNAT family N-acetyltransferase n=1 Tax=Staphylococcus sp. ACRSN TaxID=2918214 RepID=UPI001EF2D155|nr:GNAT family N-acetyltransferase [Staphylococcus sp. ACRSN]MCG7337774.1 GNAT family N-acetyltransferase [Staphylococcus sp. ACRSN]
MKISATNLESDVSTIHEIMLQSFSEYQYDETPSSALKETVNTIKNAFNKGECALVAYQDNKAIGMLRFQTEATHLYFYRLSVIPMYQRQGIAKSLLKYLEDYCKQQHISEIRCKVRANVTKNIKLYKQNGYHIYNQEQIYSDTSHPLTIISMFKQLI